MGVFSLPLVPELSDGSLLVVGHEDWVEAEPAGAARLGRDPSVEHARAAELLARRREGDELADVARPASGALDAVELCE